jgi:hypothetical protein
MTTRYILDLLNPSPYPRTGFVTAPLNNTSAAIQNPDSELILIDNTGSPLPFQIDAVDPGDPTRRTLVFATAKPLPPVPKTIISPPPQ